MSKSKVRINWNMKGTWYEACASEGHCSFYFAEIEKNHVNLFNYFK